MEKMDVDIKDNLKGKVRGHQNEKSETKKKDIAASLDFFCWIFLSHPFFLEKLISKFFCDNLSSKGCYSLMVVTASA